VVTTRCLLWPENEDTDRRRRHDRHDCIIDSDRIERMTMLNADSSFLLLEEGRKTEAEEVSTHPGGGGVNAAVAMARLGMDVALLAKLGTDARADAILARLLVPSLVARSGEGGPTLALAPGEEAPALAARGLVGGGFEMGIAAFLRALVQLGPKHVVITDGARGAFVASSAEILFALALKSKVVGTAGAGDAFAATFATYVTLGRPIEEALRAATINSRLWSGTSIPRPACCDAVNSTSGSQQRRRNQPSAGGQCSVSRLPVRAR
jgi:sugar/nucleoside kinase (ribokinase family)